MAFGTFKLLKSYQSGDTPHGVAALMRTGNGDYEFIRAADGEIYSANMFLDTPEFTREWLFDKQKAGTFVGNLKNEQKAVEEWDHVVIEDLPKQQAELYKNIIVDALSNPDIEWQKNQGNKAGIHSQKCVGKREVLWKLDEQPNGNFHLHALCFRWSVDFTKDKPLIGQNTNLGTKVIAHATVDFINKRIAEQDPSLSLLSKDMWTSNKIGENATSSHSTKQTVNKVAAGQLDAEEGLAELTSNTEDNVQQALYLKEAFTKRMQAAGEEYRQMAAMIQVISAAEEKLLVANSQQAQFNSLKSAVEELASTKDNPFVFDFSQGITNQVKAAQGQIANNAYQAVSQQFTNKIAMDEARLQSVSDAVGADIDWAQPIEQVKEQIANSLTAYAYENGEQPMEELLEAKNVEIGILHAENLKKDDQLHAAEQKIAQLTQTLSLATTTTEMLKDAADTNKALAQATQSNFDTYKEKAEERIRTLERAVQEYVKPLVDRVEKLQETVITVLKDTLGDGAKVVVEKLKTVFTGTQADITKSADELADKLADKELRDLSNDPNRPKLKPKNDK